MSSDRISPLGFLDVSGISLLDSSNASVWPSLSSASELTSTAVSPSGPEDVCSSSGSQRGGECLAPSGAFWLLGRLPCFSDGSVAGLVAYSHIRHLYISAPS